MKILLATCTFLAYISVYSQTHDSTLVQYSSLEEYLTDLDSVEIILSKHLKIKDDNFYKILGSNFKTEYRFTSYPEIALLRIVGKAGNIQIQFMNNISNEFRKALNHSFREISGSYKPKRNFEFNFAIGYIPDRKFNLDSAYQTENCPLEFYVYRRNCFDFDYNFDYNFEHEHLTPARMNRKVVTLIQEKRYEVAKHYAETLCRWHPFNKAYHELYKKITNANNGYK